jgi:hypothetical protein
MYLHREKFEGQNNFMEQVPDFIGRPTERSYFESFSEVTNDSGF